MSTLTQRAAAHAFDSRSTPYDAVCRPTVVRQRDDTVIVTQSDNISPKSSADKSKRAMLSSVANNSSETSCSSSIPDFGSLNATVAGPTKEVVAHLMRCCKSKAPQLFQHVKETLKLLQEGLDSSSSFLDVCKLTGYELRDAHATILEVDEELMDSNDEHGASVYEAEACRQWLKQLQSFVMILSKDLDRLGQPLEYASARKVWPEFISTLVGRVQQLVECMIEAEAMAVPSACSNPHKPSRLVQLRSRMPYSYWANKPSL